MNSNPGGSRVTIADVAAHAGVSRGTVSRVLNGGKWVSEDAAKAVRKAIRETGYVASASARQLRTGRSRTIAFLVDDSPEVFFADPNFQVLVKELGDVYARESVPMVILLAGSREHEKQALDFIRSGAVAGVLAASVHSGILNDLVDCGVPVVLAGAPRARASEVGYVAADEVAGGRLIGAHLIEAGARNIGVIAGPEDSPGGTSRLEGFKSAAGAALASNGVRFGDYSREAGRALANDLLDSIEGIDCIWAASDLMASGAIESIHARGLRVPEDVLVAGFDDSVAALEASVPLTTVRQPFDLISRELVTVMHRMISNGTHSAVTVPVELVVRQSSSR